MKIIKKNIKKVIDNTILCVSIKLFFLHFFNQYPNAQVNIYLKNNMAAEKCYYSANNKPSPYPPPSYPQRPSLNQSAKFPMTNTTFGTN